MKLVDRRPGSVASGESRRDELARKAAAAVKAFGAIDCIHKRGSNLILEALRSGGEFVEWNHYPPDDVRDPATGAQYYFHAHAAGDRDDGDFGHFHTFLRPRLVVDRGDAPCAVGGEDAHLSDDLCHLVAISMTPNGMPEKLFTTNRWVTDETWVEAPELIRSLPNFEVRLEGPSLELNTWLNAMFVLFRSEIEDLLVERDRVIDDCRRRNPGIDIFEDRKLDALSQLRISLPDRIERLQLEIAAMAQEDA